MSQTDFSCCMVIPTYNHHVSLGSMVAAIEAQGLPLILVNDGSKEATRQECDRLAAAHPSVTLVHREQNGGKGAAVMTGFETALQKGFSHVLQVDADGQHDLNDLPLFLAAAKAQPKAMVIGYPVFEADVPKSRLYGRKITNFWVALECGSGQIQDAMFGYRCYPLAAVKDLMRGQRLTSRMDFDIEILVRLWWRGLRVVNIPSRVSYNNPEGSNFRLLADNLQISLLHTGLVLESLFRLPALWINRFTTRA